jgi:hypothetical protein
MIGRPCIIVLPWLISNLMHKILIYLHIIHLLSSFLTGSQDSHMQRVMMPEAVYIQLRCRPPKDEQGILETCRGF